MYKLSGPVNKFVSSPEHRLPLQAGSTSPRRISSHARCEQSHSHPGRCSDLRVGRQWSDEAQPYPNKPVRILVPYAAGGAVDVLARTLLTVAVEDLGWQPVIVQSSGRLANHVLACADAIRTPTAIPLILVASGHPLNQFFYPKLPYDTFKDFTAISEVAYSPLAIVVSKNNPAKNLKDSSSRSRVRNLNHCPTACPATVPRRISPASCSTTWP